MTLLGWLGVAWAAGLGVAPSNGVERQGPVAPAWSAWSSPVAASSDFESLSRELDAAWEARRQLDNEAARAKALAVSAALRPTLDLAQRELLQRALFLLGVLELDAAGDFARLPAPVVLGELRIPAPWLDAISVAPGAPAPAAGDVAYAAQVYEQARTVAVQTGGVPLDPTADGVNEVRVDGERVVGVVNLLPGQHTLSWHEPGAVPRALVVVVGRGEGMEVEALRQRVDALAAGLASGRLGSAERPVLRALLGSPAVELSLGGRREVAWLVDGPARWGKPRLAMGVESGGWGLFGDWLATPAGCEGDLDGPTKLLVPVAGLGALSMGPWRLRAGAGVVHGVGQASAFATGPSLVCDDAPRADVARTFVGGWVSAGHRVAVAGSKSELFVRLGGSPLLVSAEAGLAARVVERGPAALEVLARGGVAANAWSGDDNRLAGTAGLGLVLLLGQP